MFSIPYNPLLTKDELAFFISFLKEYKDFIFDIYVTLNLKYVTHDAMGFHFSSDEMRLLLKNLEIIKQQTNVKLCATFNNVCVNPSVYDRFCQEFKHYSNLFTSVIIPHTLWLRLGLKQKFPHILIKNTILHRVYSASEVYQLFNEGYDCIIVDRNLIRNVKELEEINTVKKIVEHKQNQKLYITILANENCLGFCPLQQSHYTYNLTNNSNITFLRKYRSIASCRVTSQKYILQMASIIPLYSEYEFYLGLCDILKLHGRENKDVFFNSLNIVKNFALKDVLDMDLVLQYKNILKDKFAKWLDYIKTCKWSCYKCNYCNVEE